MTCPACAGEKFAERSVLPEIAFRACQGCSLLISEIKQSEVRPEFSRINNDAYQRSVGLVRRSQAVEIVDLVRGHAASGNWLDVGCSFGYLLHEARQRGYQVAGIEPDQRACAEARQLLGEDIVRLGLMDDNTVPDSSVTIISMLDVLEHIPVANLPSFAELIRRKLAPGGLWVIKVPSTEGLYFRLAHLAPSLTPQGVLRRLWQSEYEYPHTVYFSSVSLTRYLQGHGFEVVTRRYIADVPNSTIMDRLRMDDSIPLWQARIMSPALYGINFVEQARGKSDAMVMVARRP